MAVDQLDRLLAKLNISGLQQKNTPLYEVIAELIKRVKQIINEEDVSASSTTVISNTIQQFLISGDSDSGGGDGDIGPPGLIGPTGAIGATGATGAAGPITLGPMGLDADSPEEPLMIPGPIGPIGLTGATGAAGPPFPAFIYLDGNDGEDGLTIPSFGGGSGGGTLSGLEANLPASGEDGELYFPTDGVYIHRYNGSEWEQWGPIFPLVEPIDGDFAWVNQETANVDTTNGGIYLSDVAGASVVNDLRIRIKTAPSTPYTITAAFLTNPLTLNFFAFGLLFRESATGELALFQIGPNSGWRIWTRKFNSPTSFNSEYTSQPIDLQKIMFLRIADDGINRICSFSVDGQHWIQFHSIGRTDFLTADQVGFYIDVANTSFGFSTNLISWKEG